MKKFIAISILFGFGLMISLNSCKKEEETTPAELTSTATITGKVKAQLSNVVVDGENKLEFAPAGTKIFVTYSSLKLVDNPQYEEKTLTYEATVDANGNYTFSIPVGKNPFSVDLSATEFTYMQEQPSPLANVRTIHYFGGRTTANVVAGKTIIEDIDFSYVNAD